ncbi:hypothetical protein Mapa_011913 [Marchantia paleacea]|nr:hypothetical protein Mapa_011913 [Marchantia paleacea]
MMSGAKTSTHATTFFKTCPNCPRMIQVTYSENSSDVSKCVDDFQINKLHIPINVMLPIQTTIITNLESQHIGKKCMRHNQWSSGNGHQKTHLCSVHSTEFDLAGYL